MSYISMENAQKVLDLMQAAAKLYMIPQFGKLDAGQIHVKADKSLVTEVDHKVEKFLTAELLREFPGSVVIGEEGFADDPASLQALQQGKPTWIIDPLDGTGAFSRGQAGWGILVAYLERGELAMGFVLDPLAQRHIVILRGEGVFLNDVKVDKPVTDMPLAEQSCIAWMEYFHDDIAQAITRNMRHFKNLKSDGQSGVEAAFLLLSGEVDFMPATFSNPWDLLPLVILIEELGGRGAKLTDGHAFVGERLLDLNEASLLVRHHSQWQEIKEKIYSGISAERLAMGVRL